MKHPFNDEMTGWDWLFNSILCRLFKYRDIVKTEESEESIGNGVALYHSGPTLYLRRFYLWSKGNKEDGYKGAIFLHNIRRSDNDRHMHDHPWDFTSYVLAGGYYEQLPGAEVVDLAGNVSKPGRKVYPGMELHNPAEHLHKVELWRNPDGSPMRAWTIVKAGPARRIWGFQTEEGWVDYKTYLGIPQETPETNGEDIIPKT